MSAQLKNRGYHVGRRKARRYMNEMDIYPIYPKMNLSKRMQQAKVCPYLLRNVVIDAPNQAWSIDITYIPIRHGFLYLTAVIDWYSRCIVGWEVDDTLDTRMVINVLKKAFAVSKPQILNSDQGCQFTSQKYIEFVKENGIRQSMDGKSRWADNIMIERWFRSFKYEEAYLTLYNNTSIATRSIARIKGQRIYVASLPFNLIPSFILCTYYRFSLRIFYPHRVKISFSKYTFAFFKQRYDFPALCQK